MKRCLYCYQSLNDDESDYHSSCSRKFFGSPVPPEIDFDESKVEELANKIIRTQNAVTGVQPKLSVEIEKVPGMKNGRLTMVGLWGNYILKPPSVEYESLPEVEDVTMHLAEVSGIRTVPHSLVRLSSGSLAYMTRRIDRIKGRKLHMEDVCQLTGRMTENKYRGSYEQVAKTIQKYSENPGLDVINFYEQVLFSFLTGNADMHLKNFSLINTPGIGHTLSPAYDMVATALVNPDDKEDLALTLNGRKNSITGSDFIQAFKAAGINEKVQENIFSKYEKLTSTWIELIEISFLAEELKKRYTELIRRKASHLNR